MTRSELIDELVWHVLIQYFARKGVLNEWLDNVNESESESE